MRAEYEGFNKSGNFTLSYGQNLPGELRLKGTATNLELYSNSALPFDTFASPDIFGFFHDRSRVSLINCITMSHGSGTRAGEQFHYATIFPHFVIFGDQHISSSDRKIRQLRFIVDDAPTLFYDFGTFGSVINAHPHMERIIKEKKEGRMVDLGETPHLFYFTGKHEIFVADTVLGTISATHGISYSSPGPEGIHVDNAIRLNLVFDSDRTIDEAITSVNVILRFLEVIAGRPQNISKLEFLPMCAEEHPTVLDVYWSIPPSRDIEDESHKPHPASLPIQASKKPDEFASVLAKWLDRHEEWLDARVRFSAAFSYQHKYEIDRIVGAANMFDIMPSSAYSETVSLSPDFEEARKNARIAFRGLPQSPERDSVLGALGRIGKATLKRKIRSRAQLISDSFEDKFPELELVVDHAVDCRNYYVHGTTKKFDYNEHFNQVIFFTDTLEFIFAASDLIDSGWDITAWINGPKLYSHPFGKYYGEYAEQLVALKKLL
ncbi:HEPN domain-containing protein [Methylotuvimicrobium sp.]|uniref:ApeA N-terminal domain 1-containing protein n=1 Tax=Methylotuvimicrobium sp. TaxID=2822413 RepID=UPI003D64AFB9